jgi:hypothetical protein
MDIETKLINRYESISGDLVTDDIRGLLAKARVKLQDEKKYLTVWAVQRLKLFIKDLEKL